jgi:hypothetical protein
MFAVTPPLGAMHIMQLKAVVNKQRAKSNGKGQGQGTVYPVHTMNEYGEGDRIIAPQILSLGTGWR